MPEDDSTPSDPPSTPGEASQGNPKRGRYFVRKEQGPGLKKQSLTRVINPLLHEAEKIDDVAPSLPAVEPLPPPPTWDSDSKAAGASRFRRDNLAQFLPEKISTIYEGVAEFGEAEKLQRRFWVGGLVVGIAAMVAFVFYIYASTFNYSVTEPTASAEPHKAMAATLPLPEKTTLTEAEATEYTARALETLEQFTTAASDAVRQSLIPPHEPLPACLQGHGPAAVLQGLAIDAAKARPLLLGQEVAVLVPVADAQGFPRTATLLADATGRFYVDWRSLATPETVEWSEFLARKDGTPQLFRVRLVRAASGALSVEHPDGVAAVPILTTPYSRVAEEIAAAFEQSAGQPLVADAYLTADASGQVRLAGWISDKWRL